MPKSASADQIRQSYLTLIRNVHPDISGGSDEAAKRVNAAYNVLSDPKQRAAYDASLLGEECPWCEARVPASSVDAHMMNHLAEAAKNGCSVCGRQPARHFSFKANSGFILARQVHQFSGKLCATCVTGVFREMQAHNITRGPWGIFSFFMAPVYLIGNWINYGKRSGLPSPKPYDQMYDTTIGLSRPLFSRIGVWVVIGLISFVAYTVIQDASADGVSGSAGTSSGFTGPDAGWVVGACADVDSSGLVGLTSCSALHDARIVAVPISETSCPIQTDFYVDLSNGVACLEET